MESQFRPSIRKQFLDKIYQRNLNNQVKEGEEKKAEQVKKVEKTENSICKSVREEKNTVVAHKRSATPGVVVKGRSDSPVAGGVRVFIEFLTEILNLGGKVSREIERKVPSVSRALTEQFTKNPEFSLDFYISMTGVLNYLQNTEHLDRNTLSSKAHEALSHLTPTTKPNLNEKLENTENEKSENNEKNLEKAELRTATERVNLKVINTLKRVLSNHEDLITLFNSFLVLFTEADKDFEKITLKKLQPIKVIELMQKYLQTPGKLIQLCRKFPDFIENHEISEAHIQFSEDLLNSVNKSTLNTLDRTGGLQIFLNFLQTCLNFTNTHSAPMSQILLITHNSQESFEKPSSPSPAIIQLDEAVELSKELLRESSRSLTPVKLNQGSGLVLHFQQKFQKFIQDHQEFPLESLENRIVLYDKFERSILNEIRDRFVPRVADLEGFEEELSNL